MRFLLGLVLAANCLPAQAGQDAAKNVVPPSPQAPRAEGGLVNAAALRNENVHVNQIDNDSLKEANIRLGDNVTVIPEAPIESNQYATEHGRPPGESGVIRMNAPLSGWHAELFEFLQNSVFDARKFFQAGPVQPSRQNRYGARFSIADLPFGDISGEFSGRKSRGMVNGNVLVPLSSERSPLTPDPALRAIISRFLAAYPDELPNRQDFDQRALNTNSPQRIDEIIGTVRLDRALFGGRLSASHAINRQSTGAFELVAGQNPDTELHGVRSRLGWQASLTPATQAQFGFQFGRLRSVLLPEPNSVGPRAGMGYQNRSEESRVGK